MYLNACQNGFALAKNHHSFIHSVNYFSQSKVRSKAYTCLVDSKGDTSFLSELSGPEQAPFPGITFEHL